MTILEVVENYVEVKGVGNLYKACCPNPEHKDNTASFTVYEETDSFYCYGCGFGGDSVEFIRKMEDCDYQQAIKKIGEITGLSESEIKQKKESGGKKISSEKVEPLAKEVIQDLLKIAGYKANKYRGIRDEINKFFGHLTKLDDKGNVLARYYPETQDGKLVGYKCRNHPKDFSFGKIGTTGSSNELSGQVKFKAGGKYVLYVGGEEDKSAAYQLLLDSYKDGFTGIPVVSPTAGEGSAAKQAKAQYEWFDSHDIIVIGMDNDEAGRKAALEIAAVLPKDKVRIATWSYKDPNEYIKQGKEAQFIRDFYSAKEFIPSGITNSGDADGGIEEFLTAEKITLPPHLHRLEAKMRGGIRSTGAIVNVIGDTSIGKSYFSDTLVYYWLFHSPIVPTIVSLERTKEELLIDLLSLHLHKNLLWFSDGHDAVDYLHLPEVQKLRQELLFKETGEPRYYAIDERKGSIDVLKQQMEMSAKKNDSRLIIIDPLTDFLRSLPMDVQDGFYLWEKMMKKNGLVFINILHTRKPESSKDGTIRKVTEFDVLGTGTSVQSADINIVLNRNKMAEDPVERNTTEVDMPKCRGGTTGTVGGIYYDHETRQPYDKEDWLKLQEEKLTPEEKEIKDSPELAEGGVFSNIPEYEELEEVSESSFTESSTGDSE